MAANPISKYLHLPFRYYFPLFHKWLDQGHDDDEKDELCIRLYYHNGDGSGDAGSDCSGTAEQGRPWRAVAASPGAWGSAEQQRGGSHSRTAK